MTAGLVGERALRFAGAGGRHAQYGVAGAHSQCLDLKAGDVRRRRIWMPSCAVTRSLASSPPSAALISTMMPMAELT